MRCFLKALPVEVVNLRVIKPFIYLVLSRNNISSDRQEKSVSRESKKEKPLLKSSPPFVGGFRKSPPFEWVVSGVLNRP